MPDILENNNSKTSETTSLIVIITAILHLIILIINYKSLGFWPAAGAILLFTLIWFVCLMILKWVLPLVGVFLAGTIVWAGYNAGGMEGMFKSILFALAFVIGFVILIYIGPPALSGYVVYLVYDSIFWGILVGIVFAIAWFIFVKYAPWAVLSLFAASLANKIALIILGIVSFEYFKNDIIGLERNVNIDSFEDLLALLVQILNRLDLSWYMVIWCLVLGIVYKYVKDKESKNKIELN